MINNSGHESDSDDSSPESISFGASKLETTEQNIKIKDQINQIREAQKKKRIERQEKYIEQKKKKFDDLKLEEEVLNQVGDEKSSKIATKSKESKQMKKLENAPNSRKVFDDSLDDITLSDFIPLKTYKDYGISVVNLERTNKKPLVASDRAKAFKSIMYDRPGIKRQTAQESQSLSLKRKLVKMTK